MDSLTRRRTTISPLYEITPLGEGEVDYTLSCETDGSAVGEYDIVVNFDPDVLPNSSYSTYLTNAKLTVIKADGTVSAKGYDGTYDGKPHGIDVSVDPADADVKVYYSDKEELNESNYLAKGSTTNPSFTNAGTYHVYYYVTGSSKNNYSGNTGYRDVVITKVDPVVTAPVPVAGLIYNGEPQALVEPGSAEGGAMQYSLDGSAWFSDVPTGIESGSYPVIYRVVGDANHNDVAEKVVVAGIGKAGEMYRLYNPNSGEHFYTGDASERDGLVGLGWRYEGVGWNAPESSSTPVYRLYNPYGGEHHYTMDASESDYLVSVGWSYEGVGWHSDDAKGKVVYREYNPNAFSNNHNYTTDKAEHDYLISVGWQDEDTAWYGLAS